MVGRKNVSSSTSKPPGNKQQTLFDLFPKKNATLPLPQQIVPLVVPQPVLSSILPTDNDPITIEIGSHTLPPTAGSSTSKVPEIIDMTESVPTPPPLSSKPTSSRSNKASSKPPSEKEPKSTSSRSNKSGPSRPPDAVVIDLTSGSPPRPKASKATDNIFAPQFKIDGPVLPTAPAPKQTYSIFNTKPKKFSVPASPTKSTKESDAPFPSNDNQHVRGPQTIFSTSAAYQKRSSEKGPNIPMEPFRIPMVLSETFAQRTLTRKPTSSFWEKEQCIENIPSDHKRDHPAIARLAAAVSSPPDTSSSSEKLWADRWRPQRADGVLGNEAHAVYLRDWLRALEVRFATPASLDGNEEARGVKRPQVMRSVAKPRKRRRQSSDDYEFIVSDASDHSSDIGEPVETEGDDDDDFQPGAEEEPYEFRKHLANTIILSGPSGSGKTSAVYSCAEELGWEVFEVYPGIGKRNGASLETLIGEVGKNHLVRKTQARGAFGRGRDKEAEPDNYADFGFMTPNLKAATRQSVIFLEEVDILFKEDANFWPAVIRLIRDCKRAVICTCNDISLIPTGDLPLQNILEFQPCPSDVAGSYLQGLCCAEGFIVNREVLVKMYANGGCDLRHTIHRLQVLCQGFPLGTRPEQDHLLDWNVTTRESVPHADLISFMNAYMTRGSLDRPEALASTRYVSGVDDELGYPILVDALTDAHGTYEWDTKFIAAVMELSRGTRVAHAESDSFSEDYQALLDVFTNHPAFPVGVMERAVAHTDYLPWSRHIIAGEDVQEARQERGGRATRNSARYIRSIEVGEQEREALAGSSLGK
ncbi:hypothetical protein C8R45DRAFT_957986 [Mycena sanguinolenta]|nr:hypothetical protein C8R45DRAFT_957986 [Mycena sanguinolenta]